MLEGLSSLDISVMATELDMTIKDSRINNIYQLNEKTLLLKLRDVEGIVKNLLIRAGSVSYTHLTLPTN